MATLVTQSVKKSGLKAVYQGASALDTVAPSTSTFIHVKNANAGSVTVTVHDTKSVKPDSAIAFNPDIAVVIAPGTEEFVGTLGPDRFLSTDNTAHITYSATSGVTVAAIKI